MAVLRQLVRHASVALAALAPIGLVGTPALAVFGGRTVAGSSTVARSLAAVLYQTADGAHLCTAIAISPRLVLTAAHCTDGDRRLMRVIFSPDLTAVADDRLRAVSDVARAGPTPDAKGSFAYDNPDDIAVVLLDSPAPAGTRFAALADDLPALTGVAAAGYGATSDFRRPDAEGHHQIGFDKVLRAAAVPLSSTGPALLVADQTHGAGLCTGDSGGPAFLPGADLAVVGLLVGVSSPRATNDYCRGKAYFAAIPRWKPWILAAAAHFGQKL